MAQATFNPANPICQTHQQWIDEAMERQRMVDEIMVSIRMFESSPEGLLYKLMKSENEFLTASSFASMCGTREGDLLFNALTMADGWANKFPSGISDSHRHLPQGFGYQAAGVVLALMVEKAELEERLAIALAAKPAPKSSNGGVRL